jgi:hypothetical protein
MRWSSGRTRFRRPHDPIELCRTTPPCAGRLLSSHSMSSGIVDSSVCARDTAPLYNRAPGIGILSVLRISIGLFSITPTGKLNCTAMIR